MRFFLGKDMAHQSCGCQCQQRRQDQKHTARQRNHESQCEKYPCTQKKQEKARRKIHHITSFDVYIVPCLFFIIAQKAGHVFALGKNISYNSLTAQDISCILVNPYDIVQGRFFRYGRLTIILHFPFCKFFILIYHIFPLGSNPRQKGTFLDFLRFLWYIIK